MKKIAILVLLVCLLASVSATYVQLPLTVTWNLVFFPYYNGTLCLEETNLFGDFDYIDVTYSHQVFGNETPPSTIIFLVDQGGNKYCDDLKSGVWELGNDTLEDATILVKFGGVVTFNDYPWYYAWSADVNVTKNDTNHTFNLMNTICDDSDGDGYDVNSPTCPAGNDCNDNNNTIHPGRAEICDGIDNDCDGLIDKDENGDNLTLPCGEGSCLGIITCASGSWSGCNTSGKDGGICTSCDANSNEVYNGTQESDCDPWDLVETATCTNDPDNNPFTWDYAPTFNSYCLNISLCSSYFFTHTCNIANCSAECENNNDCPPTECDYMDGCVGTDYHDYNNVSSICASAGNCSCGSGVCNLSTIYYNDTRCDKDNDDVFDIFDCNDYDPSIGECPGCKLCTEDVSLLTNNGTCEIAITPAYISTANYEYCPTPIYDKFSTSLTTNFSNVSLFNAYIRVGIKGIGGISFTQKIDVFKFISDKYHPLDLNASIDFQPRIISLDTINLNELNISADLTFFNLGFTNYYILKDGTTTQNYTTIQSPSAANSYTLIIGIDHFTTYEVRQGSSPQPPRDGGGSGGGGGGGIFILRKEEANETKGNKTKEIKGEIPGTDESEETEQQGDFPGEEGTTGAKIKGAIVVVKTGGIATLAVMISTIIILVAASMVARVYYVKRSQRLKEEAIIDELERIERMKKMRRIDRR